MAGGRIRRYRKRRGRGYVVGGRLRRRHLMRRHKRRGAGILGTIGDALGGLFGI